MKIDLRVAIPLISLAILACFAVSLHVSAQSDVDKYISTSRGEVSPVYDARFAPDPRSSRKAWNLGTDEDEDANATGNGSADAGESVTSPPPSEQPVSAPSLRAVSGSWALQMTGPSTRSLDLELYQSGGTVFGHGSLKTGEVVDPVSAVGEVSGEVLTLRLVSSDSLYSLDLGLKEPVAGSYTAYSQFGDSWAGAVMPA
ncbi:MAG: hypothetical protein A4E45_01545 [Methanosaeta sp. PtaB.Bin039]|nr:MAG: hypothetical protein A4E45_01545 [Methanosaeta sp. PtaB.Bin039]OPY46823.1 MAG: hypothetical protein A4E47_00473 [Methanosaeta sp. PtaU1.Bin028]